MNNKIILGTAQFGMIYGIASNKKIPKKNEIYEILNYAYANQINTLDTANIYGNSENIVGSYLKDNANQNWHVITKNNNLEIPLLNKIKEAEKKLNNLPNVFMAHSLQMFLNKNFQHDVINLKKKIPIKIGVSLYDQKEIDLVLNTPFVPEVIQLPINALDTRLVRNKTLAKIKDFGVEIHARSIFLQGLFFLKEPQLKKYFSDAINSIKMIENISLNQNLNISELSLLWVNSLREIDKIVIGIESLEQLKLNILALTKKIDDSVFNDLLNIKYENENILNPQNWKV